MENEKWLKFNVKCQSAVSHNHTSYCNSNFWTVYHQIRLQPMSWQIFFNIVVTSYFSGSYTCSCLGK